MSFGSAAAEYDVRFGVNTGQFRADMSEVRSTYERTTGAMSSEAIRAAVAQEKLDRAIRQHGPSSLAAKAATLSYRNEMAQLSSQAGRTGRSVNTAQRDMEGFGRGALIGSGALRGFGRAALYASTSLLGGYGLIFAIRQVLTVAKQEETALAQVRVALTNAGLSWRDYGAQIDEATTKLEHQTAFTRDEVDSAFAQLITRTGNVAQSINLASVAADVARGRNIDLASAVSLVIKAANGQSGALRRLGLDVNAVKTSQDALRDSGVKASAQQKDAAKQADAAASREGFLAALRAKYHGQAAAYLQTDAGKQALFDAELKESEAIIGQGLLPTINRLLGELSTWLEKMNRTGQLQRDVNRAVKDGTAVVHDIRKAFHDVKPEIDLVISGLGGIERTIETALVIGAALKIRKFAANFGLIRTASSRTRTAIVADAAAEETAIAGLETPVIIPVAFAVAGGVGLNAFLNWAKKGLPGSATGSGGGKIDPNNPATWSDAERAAYAAQHGPETYAYYLKHPARTAQIDAAALAAQNRKSKAPGTTAGAFTPTTGPNAPKPPPPATAVSFALQNALLNAQLTPSSADDRAVYEQQAAALEQLLKQPGLTHANILDLKGQLVSVTGFIQGIDKANAAAAAAKTAKAKAAAAKLKAQRAAAARKAATALRQQRAEQIKQLTEIPTDLIVQEKTAKTEQQKLAALNQELLAVKGQLALLEKLNLGKDAIRKARLTEASLQGQINKILAKTTVSVSAAAFYAEAANEEKLYGSNVGPGGYPLAGQDARFQLAVIAKHLKVIATHTKKTAAATTVTAKARPTMGEAARALATAGI